METSFSRIDLQKHAQSVDFLQFDPLKTLHVPNRLKRKTEDFENSFQKVEFKKSNKIVTIENCPTLCDAVKAVKQPNFIKPLTESSVFVLILSIADPASANEWELVQEFSAVVVKPMILQLNNENGKSIFFKEFNESIFFKKLELTENLRFEEVSLINDIGFENICKFLHFGANYGKFNFDLMKTEVAMEKSFCGLRLIDWAVKHNSMLCLKFLHLFDPNLETINDNSSRVLEVAAQSGTLDSFKVLLNSRDFETIEPSQGRILTLNSANNESLLMIAVREGKLEIVKFLLRNDSDVNKQNEFYDSASDIAMENERFDILIELLYNDAPFPKNFSIKEFKSRLHDVRLKVFINERQRLHNAIENGQLDEVKRCIENKNLKFAYNEKNQCALTTALDSKNFEAYSFLRSKGFSDGVDFVVDMLLQELDDSDRKNLKKSNLKYFPGNSSQHIMDLVSKSRLAFENDQNNFGKIQECFEKLDAISEISPILKIVASSDKIDIVFDFNRDSIEEMDPTSDAHGRTYNKSGHILIAAKRDDDLDVLGTLAHELTHYAFHLVYNNNCLPFRSDDESKQMSFKAIVDIYDNESYKSKNYIIAKALNESLSDKLKLIELSVRVPHLLAMHSNTATVIAEIREDFSLLFGFFEHQTLPDLHREEQLIQPRRRIREANISFGVLSKAIRSDWLSYDVSPMIDISRNVFIQSSVPDLVLESLVRLLQHTVDNDIRSNNIFVNLEQLFNNENLKKIKTVAEAELKPTIFVIEHSNDFNHRVIENCLHRFFNDLKIVFISSNKDSAFRCLNCQSLLDVEFKWNDLTEKSKSRILGSKVVFQDAEVFMNDILTKELLLQEISIELLLKPSKIKLKSFSKSLPSPPRVFIERTFKSDETSTKYDLERLCYPLERQKVVLISDSAGMGKSTSAARIARDVKLKNPLLWVVFVDLKQHTGGFLQDNDTQPESIGTEFLGSKLLKLESEFEAKLFESFYQNEKVIFVIDGFDEISPNYERFVTKILKAINISGNYLLITTRPHCAKKLENELKTKAFTMMPFSDENQIEFLTEYWKHKSNNAEFEARLKDFLRKCSSLWSSANFYATPIHIYMLAEVFDDRDLSNIDDISPNIYSLYKSFITKKINIWNTKGPLAANDSTTLQLTTPATNWIQIFNRLALERLFHVDDVVNSSVPEIPEEIIEELIARVGIVSFSQDGSVQFTHQTYAEYFAADFIMNCAFKKKSQTAIVRLFVKVVGFERFGMVRKFMNDRLLETVARNSNNNFEAGTLAEHFEIASRIEDEREKKEKFTVSHLIMGADISCNKLFTFIFETLNFNYKVKVMLLKDVFEGSGFIIEVFTIIWNCVRKIVDEENIEAVQKDLLFAKRGKEIMMKALEQEHRMRYFTDENVYEETRASPKRVIMQNAKHLLDENEFLKFLYDEENGNFPFSKVIKFDVDLFEEMWEAAKMKMGEKNLHKLVVCTDESGNTILHSFHENPVKLLKWLEVIKTILNSDELNDHLAAKNIAGELFIHKIFVNQPLMRMDVYRPLTKVEVSELWDFFEHNTSIATQRKMLLQENNEGKILIESSIDIEEKLVIDFIFEITESLLKSEGENIIDFLRQRGSLTTVILNTIVCSNEVFDKYSSKLNANELKTILLSKTGLDYNILHCLGKTDNPEDAETLWDRIIKLIDDSSEIIRLFIEIFSRDRCDFFNVAAEKNNHFLIKVLEWYKLNFKRKELKKIFAVLDDKRPLLHTLAEFGDESLNQKCLEFFSSNLSPEDQREVLLIQREYDEIPIYKTSKNKNPGVVETVSKTYYDVFTHEDLETIFEKIVFVESFPRHRVAELKRFHEFRSALAIQWKIQNVPRAKNNSSNFVDYV